LPLLPHDLLLNSDADLSDVGNDTNALRRFLLNHILVEQAPLQEQVRPHACAGSQYKHFYCKVLC
jgi:hypothetical protein